jgi:hypothetical protein
MFVYHAVCVAVSTPAATSDRARRAPMTLRCAVAVASAGLVLAAGWVAHQVFPELYASMGAWGRWGLRPPLDVLWLAYYALVNPWVEERFWRATLLGTEVRWRVGDRGAWGLAALAFGGHHWAVLIASFGWPKGSLLLVPVLACGAAWTALYRHRRDLALNVSSHLGADLALAALYIAWVR